MAEELRIVRRDNYRLAPQHRPEVKDLVLPVEHEIPGVGFRPVRRLHGIVRLLPVQRDVPRDSMVLEPKVAAHAVGMEVRTDNVVVGVESEIAVELAVGGVARISLVRAPHLPRTFDVAGENRHAGGRLARRVKPVLRNPGGVQKTVGIQEEETQTRFRQIPVEARDVRALRKPDPARPSAEMFLVIPHRNLNLRAPGPGVQNVRQERVRRRARHDLEVTGRLQVCEGAQNVPVQPVLVQIVDPGEMVPVQLRRGTEGRHQRRPHEFLFRQLAQPAEVLRASLLQKRIRQHLAQRRREAHRQTERHPLLPQPAEGLQQRKVRLRDRFKQPVFLQKPGLLRVPDERQMRVQDEANESVQLDPP